MSKTCWSCGHFMIGAGCWKDGTIGNEGWKDVGPEDSCEEWVPEGTPGTATDFGYIEEENEEYLKDDMSNL